MLFDTDILIHAERGAIRAANAIDAESDRFISALTLMELFQGARDTRHQHIIRRFLSEYGFTVLPLTENIGHRAIIYIEEYALSNGIRAGDAIVAATAVENAQPLLTGNARHFRAIKDLDLITFHAS